MVRTVDITTTRGRRDLTLPLQGLRGAIATIESIAAALKEAPRGRLAVFGASSSGCLLLHAARLAEAEVCAWVDSDPARVGSLFIGQRVEPVERLAALDPSPTVVALATTSPAAAAAMAARVRDLGLASVEFVTFQSEAPPVATAPALIEPWREAGPFVERYAAAAPFTLVDPRRAHVLHQATQQVASLEGDFAELGVYRGGTALLVALARVPPGRALHLFDTFAGMPRTDPTLDRHRAGDFADTAEADVRALLEGQACVHFHVGYFPDTAAGLAGRRFAFVHVDADIYRSVADACAFFYPRLVPGGVMVFDDYGFPSCPGARAAVDEFFAGQREQPLYLSTGQAMVTRLP